jgi:hypothetical protein
MISDTENIRQGLGLRGNWSGMKWMISPGPERTALLAGKDNTHWIETCSTEQVGREVKDKM